MAKCRKENCQNEAPDPWWYCSRTCAPYGTLGGESNTRSERTDAYISKERGEVSTQSSTYAQKTHLDLQKNANSLNKRLLSQSDSERSKELIMNETKNRLSLTKESDGVQNPSVGVMRETKQEQSVGATQTQQVRSAGSSQILEPEEYQSMSLIDKSNDVLLELMSSVKMRVSDKLDPALINSAANCAAQIQKLLRLKMDVIKQRKAK